MKYILILLLLFSTQINFGCENLNVRDSLVQSLHQQLKVREIAPNRSPEIDEYNRSVGVVVGSYWCGSFVGYNLTSFNIENPNSAWSPAYAQQKDIIWKPKYKNKVKLKAGDVITIYYSKLKRVGHTGFLIDVDKNGYFITIEGNTSGKGSRNGDGVYKKKRDSNKVYAISRYLKQ